MNKQKSKKQYKRKNYSRSQAGSNQNKFNLTAKLEYTASVLPVSGLFAAAPNWDESFFFNEFKTTMQYFKPIKFRIIFQDLTAQSYSTVLAFVPVNYDVEGYVVNSASAAQLSALPGSIRSMEGAQNYGAWTTFPRVDRLMSAPEAGPNTCGLIIANTTSTSTAVGQVILEIIVHFQRPYFADITFIKPIHKVINFTIIHKWKGEQQDSENEESQSLIPAKPPVKKKLK